MSLTSGEFWLLAILVILVQMSCGNYSELTIGPIQCEGLTNPAGTGATPKFNWLVKPGKRNQKQTAWQIIVASTSHNLKKNSGDLWDSGKIYQQNPGSVRYQGAPLAPGASVFWKVRVWDDSDRESKWSQTGTFVTGLFDSTDWNGAQWIALELLPDSLKLVPGVHGSGNNLGHLVQARPQLPYFRKEFRVGKKIERAFCFVSGLGHYELFINGHKAGNHFLTPGWTDYRKSCLFNTFDVTALLKSGQNAMGALVGTGFFHINRERYRKLVIAYGLPQLILKLQLDYTDGSQDVIVTDTTWTSTPSPITYTSIYGGEDYDARLEQPGWSDNGFDDAGWQRAIIVAGPGGILKPEKAYPLQVMQILECRKITQPRKNCFVYDFGQNASGIIRLNVTGRKGKTVKLIPGELLAEDSLVTQDASGQPFYFTYTLAGTGGEEWQPRFSYYGFRYVQVEGAVPVKTANPENLPVLNHLQFLHTRNSSPEIGHFHCSNPLFNKIYDLVNWAIKSNLASVATDCPHREKLGWLEQAHLMGNSIQYIYDIHNLYDKIIDDMIEAQLETGLVPDIAPEYVPFAGGFRDSPEWGSACVILPWYLYRWYGDMEPMQRAYPMMKKYLAYLATKADYHILSHGLGDWYDLGPKSPGPAQLTPISLTATAIYYYDLTLLAKMAGLLGQREEARHFFELSEKVKNAFNQKFFNKETKVYATASQTAYAMPIYFGMVEAKYQDQVFNNLVNSIIAGNKALTAGDVGYRYLLRALEQGGANQLIYDMNARSDVPGYGYQLARGATALTESWAALKYVSNNHMMLGHLVEWFFSGLAGIRQAENSVGFANIIIDPHPVGDITRVESEYRAVSGAIVCNWRIIDNNFELDLEIPVRSQAVVYLPAGSEADVRESGKLAMVSADIKFLKFEGNRAVFDVGPGKYRFQSKLKNS